MLEFHPSQGWEPLCKFLDKKAPDTPYPKINEGDFVRVLTDAVLSARMREKLQQEVLIAAPIALAIGAFWMYWW